MMDPWRVFGAYQARLSDVRKRSAEAYVRFGLPPAGERSNIAGPLFSGASRHLVIPNLFPEQGVSVFGASVRDGGALVIDTDGGRNWQLRGQFAAFFFEMPPKARRVYRVYGEEVGTGGDGEPLLRNCAVEEIPLTTPIWVDSWSPPAPDTRIIGLEPAKLHALGVSYNRWRYLDGTREGHRTPQGSENYLEAFAPPGAREVLHEHNERKWRRRRGGR